MLDSGIVKEIFISFAGTFTGTLLAISFIGITWLIKSAHKKHGSEMFALAKFERIFASNMEWLKDNFEFIDEWLEALNKNRPYSFQFGNFIINEEDTYKLSNLFLINKILSLNYRLKRTDLDLNNLYKSYWDTILKIDSIQDKQQKLTDLKTYNETIRLTLEEIKKNYEPLKNNLVEVIAIIRVAANVRFHSIFGYLSVFFKDIFPTINEKAIETEIKILKEQIKERTDKLNEQI